MSRNSEKVGTGSKRRGLTFLAAAFASAMFAAGTATAQPFDLIDTIQIPGTSVTKPLTAFDISFADPALGLYLLADRTTASLDIVDVRTDTYIAQVGGFVGAAASPDTSGPNGVCISTPRFAWVGNAPSADTGNKSAVFVVDLLRRSIVDVIITGGKARADECAYDPKQGLMLFANDADTPPYISLISTRGDSVGHHQVLQTISFPDATNGIEQAQYSKSLKSFFLNLPEIGGNAGHGAVVKIDPKRLRVSGSIATSNCEPAGLALGPNDEALLGCNDDAAQIINLKTGALVATPSAAINRSDEVWYDKKSNLYFAAAGSALNSSKAPAPVLGIIDAGTHAAVQLIPTTVGDHAITVDPNTTHVFLPDRADAACPFGCIKIFGFAD